MAFKTLEGEQKSLSEINIVPLVDVMLVLLIIFMVTAPFLSEGIDVELPEASASASSIEKKDRVLTINQQGQVFILGDEKTAYTPEELEPILRSMFPEGTEQEKTVFLRADRNVPYGAVVEVMSICKNAGISRIGMITQPVTKEGG